MAAEGQRKSGIKGALQEQLQSKRVALLNRDDVHLVV
jgi:hypothetical protein